MRSARCTAPTAPAARREVEDRAEDVAIDEMAAKHSTHACCSSSVCTRARACEAIQPGGRLEGPCRWVVPCPRRTGRPYGRAGTACAGGTLRSHVSRSDAMDASRGSKRKRRAPAAGEGDLLAQAGAAFACVSYAAVLAGRRDAVAQLRSSLRSTGAAVLTLKRPGDGAGDADPHQPLRHALGKCFQAAHAGVLADTRVPAAVRVLPGRERQLEHALHDTLGLGPRLERLEPSCGDAYRSLSAVGRAVLQAVDKRAAAAPLADVAEVVAGVKAYDAGCSTLCISRLEPRAAPARRAPAALVDLGLLTLVHARGPGLELLVPPGPVKTRGRGDGVWCPLAGAGDDSLVILVGRTLAAASGGAFPAAAYRVVAQPEPRCYVALRLRGMPGAALACAPGGTVAGFEAQFQPTSGAARALRRTTTTGSGSPDSAADLVFQVPQLAELIASFLAMDTLDSGGALARAALLCRGMRAAVGLRWPLLCRRLRANYPRAVQLPTELSETAPGDAQRWRRTYRSSLRKALSSSIEFAVVRQADMRAVHFRANMTVRFRKVRRCAGARCMCFDVCRC